MLIHIAKSIQLQRDERCLEKALNTVFHFNYHYSFVKSVYWNFYVVFAFKQWFRNFSVNSGAPYTNDELQRGANLKTGQKREHLPCQLKKDDEEVVQSYKFHRGVPTARHPLHLKKVYQISISLYEQ